MQFNSAQNQDGSALKGSNDDSDAVDQRALVDEDGMHEDQLDDDGNQMDGEDEEYELDQQQVIQAILVLGNEIWHNLGQEDDIYDYSVFFQHQFYVRCFQMAYPHFDFQGLLDDTEDEESPEKMAEVIQALIDLLSQEILDFDMNHIRGEDIVNGNADHCINLLQILQQISHANLMQREGANESDESPDRSSAMQGEAQQVEDGRDSAPDGAESSDMKKSPERDDNQSGLFDMDGPQSAQQDKQQFLDNLDEDVMGEVQLNHGGSGLSANKVGDVIGQELDIEFDDEIKENINEAGEYQRSGEEPSDSDQVAKFKQMNEQAQGSSSQNYQVDDDDEEGDDGEDMVDPDQVELMVGADGQQHFDLDDEMEVNDEMRDLNRQTDNMADFPQQFSVEGEGEDDMMIEEGQPMQQYDGADDEYDQEVDMNEEEAQMLQDAIQRDRDDDQDGEDLSEEEIDLDEIHPEILEAGKQLGLDAAGMRALQEQLMAGQAEGAEEEMEEDMEQSDQMEGEMDEQQHVVDNDDDEDDEDKDAQELAQMLEGVDGQQDHKEDDDEFRQILRGGQEIETGPDNHYGLEADDNDDGQQEVVEELEDVEYMLNQHQRGDDDEGQGDESGNRNSNDIEAEMAEQLQMINSQESQQYQQQEYAEDQPSEAMGEAEGEDDEEDELIDIDHLADNEKVVLWHYLSEEYQKNPDQLPMPRDIVEQFLADNQELVERLGNAQAEEPDDDEGEDEVEAEGEDEEGYEFEEVEVGAKMAAPPAEVIDSNEVIVEGAGEDEEDLRGAMLKDQESSPSREQQMYVNENGQYVVEDHEEIIQVVGEDEPDQMDEDDGEEMIYGEEEMEVVDQEQQEMLMQMQLQQQQQMQEEDYGEEQMGEQHDEGLEDGNAEEEEEEEQQHQILDPQYGLVVDGTSPSHELPADGAITYEQLEMLVRNNMLTPEQQYMLEQQLLAQNQQIQMQQQNMLPVGQQARTVQQPRRSSAQRTKKKIGVSSRLTRPPMSSFGGQSKGSTAGLSQRAPRPLTAAASKKYRRSKFAGNTISHEEDMVGGIPRTAKRAMDFGLVPAAALGSAARTKGSSQGKKRPGTAKPRRAFGLGPKVAKRHSNYNIAVPGPISSTPSHRLRSAKNGALVGHKGLIVPQQSQMFTSFGMPAYGQSLSHRKVSGSNSRKKQYSQLYGSNKQVIPSSTTNKLKKKPPVPSAPNAAASTARRKKKAVEPRAAIMQQSADQQLIDMPVLSDDYLNQLNEEQLQSLLEHQKMLMALQQQTNEQEQIGDDEMDAQDNMEDPIDDDNQPLMDEDGNMIQHDQDDEQLAAVQGQQQVEYVASDEVNYIQQNDQMDPQQQALIQQQMIQMQPQRYVQKPRQAQGIRSRGRARGAPLAQSAKIGLGGAAAVIQAARIPSAGRGRGGVRASSGSRSAHGSRKRAQKARSSLNVAANNAISGSLSSKADRGASFLPTMPSASSQVFRSQKLAAHIYSTQSDLTNLVSQRKKPSNLAPMRQSLKAKKRAQPHQAQGGKVQQQMQQMQSVADQQYDMQAQLLAQQSQYNQMLQNEQQQSFQQYGGQESQQQQDGMQNEEIIDEASPDQEEADSQTQSQVNQQKMPVSQLSQIAADWSTQQIIELLQQNEQSIAEANASNMQPENVLPEDVQMHLQQVLQDRMMQQQQYLLSQQQMTDQQKLSPTRGSANRDTIRMIQGMADGDRVQSYQNICNILTESVSKAKQRYNNMSSKRRASRSQSPHNRVTGSIENDEKIQKQKKQFENLLKQYQHDIKLQENKRRNNLKRQERIQKRDEKIKELRQKRFEDEMLGQQRSQIVKRSAQQIRLQKKVMRLASDFEKSKVIEERKRAREAEKSQLHSKKAMVETIENYFKDRISMLKDRIDQEKFDRKVANEAQKHAMAQMKRELDDQKRKEVQRYIQLLQQQDEQFDVENLNLGRLEGEIIKLYKGK